MQSATEICFSATPSAIKQSPVNSSAPSRITIIKPTGNTTAAVSLASPTFATECAATLLAAAPIPIIIPANIAFPNSLPIGVAAFALHPCA